MTWTCVILQVILFNNYLLLFFSNIIITKPERVISMSYPSSGLEASYRNKIQVFIMQKQT
jgi:hypothetical protein